MKNEDEALLLILKNPYEEYNSRGLSKIVGISHAGMFKILKKLENQKILISRSVGRAKIYSINFENILAVKRAEMALIMEARQNERWIEEFNSLKHDAEFIVIFGSILRRSESARDIDLLIIADRKKFGRIKEQIYKKNNLMAKKIHLLLQTPDEFLSDFEKKNKSMLEIIRTGAVLFGQDEFVNLIKKNGLFNSARR